MVRVGQTERAGWVVSIGVIDDRVIGCSFHTDRGGLWETLGDKPTQMKKVKQV